MGSNGYNYSYTCSGDDGYYSYTCSGDEGEVYMCTDSFIVRWASVFQHLALGHDKISTGCDYTACGHAVIVRFLLHTTDAGYAVMTVFRPGL